MVGTAVSRPAMAPASTRPASSSAVTKFWSFYSRKYYGVGGSLLASGGGVYPGRSMGSRRRTTGSASATVTGRPNSALSDVTPASRMPHGTIRSK